MQPYISPKAAQALLAQRRAKKPLLDPSFPQQCEFIKDPHTLKALFCTRRAAKSYTAGLYLIQEALATPRVNCLFIGLTRASALGIVWKDILKDICRKQGIAAKFNSSNLTCTLPNGSVIWVTGANDGEDEMNKLLGRKYKLVCLDEASMYTINLEHLVYGVLGPAMSDQAGTICMMGTASNFPRGLFYNITTGKEKGWKLFTWTAHDNPHVAVQWQAELDKIDRDRPLFKETPLYRQWYLNEWVVDEGKLVYKFNEEKNLIPALPTGLKPEGWTYVLGVDTGWEDDNAFVLTAYHDNLDRLFVLKTFHKPHMTFDEVVEKIREFMADELNKPTKVVIDGANKQGVESMRIRSGIPFEYADKQDKVSFIEMLNGDMVQAKVAVIQRGNEDLVNELAGLVWKTDGDRIVLPKREHPSLPNHMCDALLYAWRMGYHYHAQAEEERIVLGSKRWYEKQAEAIWEREKEQLQRVEQGLQGDWPGCGEV